MHLNNLKSGLISVSVIITTYNRSTLAKRAIQSVLNQTYKPNEIIIIEDASESDLEEWISDVKDFEIKYIKNIENVGLAASRNIGLNKSKCEYVSYLDDDDVWLPNKLEEQIKVLISLSDHEKSVLGCVQVGHMILNQNNTLIGIGLPINKGNIKRSIINFGVHTFSSSFFFNRNIMIKIGGFDEKLVSGIDDDIWMNLALNDYHNFVVNKPLVIVYKDTRQSMMSNTDKRITGIMKYIEKWSPIYQDWYGEKLGKIMIDKYFITVIGALASEKLINRHWRDFYMAISVMLKKTNLNYRLFFYSIYSIFRPFLSSVFPIFGKIKRSIYSKIYENENISYR
jgi:glycosyltransferase involved in cell wall biosynthesis